ncbi:single-stranded DNA-binding protein [Arthrobacter echini]|uniref:Single-stranded DNA-binding protein n=1 Tax=Arthrobacter echini TaxID=1529066 RepID=A0A5D0XSD7_9MICC|nr:single-stranded DNA-binding protein [Arthrobacter echini]TYC99475.1 single-stranded DNA-binding protein [Arthrobacter echini]
MTDIITVRGYVATEVRLTLAHSGLPISGFRMCSTERRFDKEANGWVDGTTNWYSVSMFRQLATNAGASIKKGDRVIVTGRLRIRPWSSPDGRTGTSVEIDADTAGHDLMWGTANFRRNSSDRSEPQAGPADATATGSPEHGAVPDGVDPATGELFEGVFDPDSTPEDGPDRHDPDHEGTSDREADERQRGGEDRAVAAQPESVPF